MPACRVCKTGLTEANWYPSCRRRGNRICGPCCVNYAVRWKRENPSDARKAHRRYNRKLLLRDPAKLRRRIQRMRDEADWLESLLDLEPALKGV